MEKPEKRTYHDIREISALMAYRDKTIGELLEPSELTILIMEALKHPFDTIEEDTAILYGARIVDMKLTFECDRMTFTNSKFKTEGTLNMPYDIHGISDELWSKTVVRGLIGQAVRQVHDSTQVDF